mgnify:CR=1 FL=1
MSMSDRDGFIWLDGDLVPWREAKVCAVPPLGILLVQVASANEHVEEHGDFSPPSFRSERAQRGEPMRKERVAPGGEAHVAYGLARRKPVARLRKGAAAAICRKVLRRDAQPHNDTATLVQLVEIWQHMLSPELVTILLSIYPLIPYFVP